ncbi:MAG: sigma-54 dependent transcriptional regulator [Desulfosalsimonas sp.]
MDKSQETTGTEAMHTASVLVIDDEESLRYTFDRFLSAEGHRVHAAATYQEAVKTLDQKVPWDVIFADIVLPGDRTGMDFLRQVRRRNINIPVIMITGQPEIETAAEAVRQGAFDYVPKPVKRETLLRLTRSALKFRRIGEEKQRIEKQNLQMRRHLEAVLESVTEAIITVDRNMRVISANTSLREICRAEPESIKGIKLDQTGLDCLEKCAEITGKILARHNRVKETRIEAADGQGAEKLLAVSGSVLNGQKAGSSGAVLVIRDITRIEHLERKLENRERFFGITGRSRAMQEIYGLIEDLSGLDTTVLITGESGTGKELVAEAVHRAGPKSEGPLIKVNCSALSENLLESELFGHAKGAFTGADKDRPGRFEAASGGTIFLDEIGDLPLSVQVKLLRVLQEKEIERVGETGPRKVDVRIISATNRDLAEKTRQKTFREDLYYRLKVMTIDLPALRERKEDIPLLIEHFRKELNPGMNRSVESFSEEAMTCLLEYTWPGNIRELRHSLEHAFVLCRGHEIRTSGLTRAEQSRAKPAADRAAIMEALAKTGGNKAGAARLLGVSRQTIYRKIREYQI